MHLAAWGRIDTGRGNAIDMTLGIPGPSLLPLGLTDLPDDYVFMIPMHGTSTHPEVDIIRWGASCCFIAQLTFCNEHETEHPVCVLLSDSLSCSTTNLGGVSSFQGCQHKP